MKEVDGEFVETEPEEYSGPRQLPSFTSDWVGIIPDEYIEGVDYEIK